MAEPQTTSPDHPLLGSPRAVVDDASIQKAMDKNKESLKVKLMLRRPIGQLVEQGILPPLKASPEFYERSKKLERARMEDFLKRQIQRRPDRQSLIEQHILEDTIVSPSLQGAERQLKKVRLADDLNDRLSHRPGPLELVKGNILLADERLAQALKEGSIHFKATSEGEPVKHPPPLFHLEDPESSSDATPSPLQDLSDTSLSSYSPLGAQTTSLSDHIPVSNSGLLICQPPAPTVTSCLSPAASTQRPPVSAAIVPQQRFCTSASVCSPQPVDKKLTTGEFCLAAPAVSTSVAVTTTPPVVTTAPESPAITPAVAFTTGSTTSKSESGSLSAKSRKKCKSKVQPKTRTIKFHEYKGPPSAQKAGNASLATCSSESSYELLLKQQQLFLQWQLEWQQKYPHIIMPSAAQQQKQMQESKTQADTGLNAAAAVSSSVQQAVAHSNPGPKVPVTETIVVPAPKPHANQSKNSNNCNNANTNNIVVATTAGNICNKSQTTTPPVPSNQSSSPPSTTTTTAPKLVSRLEDLKVSDLKVQLKKRSLPVSGSKPQLLERLKPFTSEVLAALRSAPSVSPIHVDHSDSGSSKSTDSPSPATMAVIAAPFETLPQRGEADRAAEVIASGEVAMDVVGDGMQAHTAVTLSPHFSSADSTALSGHHPFISNGFIVNKDMMKLCANPVAGREKAHTLSAPTHQHQLPGHQQQFQLQFQYPIFQTQGPAIAIPLASIATPQFQVITSVAQNQSPSQQSGSSSHYSQRRKSINTCSPYEQQRPSSAAVKASLAAFLQSQAAQNQNLAPEQTFVSSEMSYPHVVLLPADQTLGKGTKQQRAHSFSMPSDSSSQLANNSRTGSLPSFPIARSMEKTAAAASLSSARPPPPNYEEATKAGASSKSAKRQAKKNSKSQALEDVLEILVKSGELPPSATDEPQTPTTPSGKHLTAPQTPRRAMFPSTKLDTIRETGPRVKEEAQPVVSCQQQQQSSSDGNAVDLDLLLLHSLGEPMDYGDETNRNAASWLSLPQDSDSHREQTVTSADQRQQISGQGDQNCEVSLSWMDVSTGDDNQWMSELIAPDSDNNRTCDHRSREVPSNDFSQLVGYFPQKNSTSIDRRSLFRPTVSPVTISQSCGSKDHDPVLPNNMVGTVSCTEPLLDLFFDERDMQAHELGVWDRLDFAA